MATSIGFYLSAVSRLGSFLSAAAFSWRLHWRPRDTAYQPAPSRIRARIFPLKEFVTSRRDCSRRHALAFGSAPALGWFMLIASIIPLSDAVIVLHQGGSRTIAFGVHG